MRAVSEALRARLARPTTRLAWFVRITRADGTVMGFTTHDRDVVLGGLRYRARSAFTASSIEANSAMSVDNLEVMGVLTHDDITEGDLAAGVYDGARVDVYLADWSAPNLGDMHLSRSTVGQTTVRGTQYVMELRGLHERAQKVVGAYYLPTCRHDYGKGKDSRGIGCPIDPETRAVDAVVVATDGARTLRAEALAGRAADAWKYGWVMWKGGANIRARMEIQSSTGDGTLTLCLNMPRAIAPGDTVCVYLGCARTKTACKAIAAEAGQPNSWLDFGGHPHLPGADGITQHPIQRAADVG